MTLKGASYFKTKKTNIVNLVTRTGTTWKPIFSGSHMLSWEDEGAHNKPINAFVVGHFDRAELGKPTTGLFDPAYRLELLLDTETINAFKTILENSPLNNEEPLNSPLKGHSMAFQVKWKTLQKSDAQDIGAFDPFPFLFDGREMAKGQKTLLKNYPADQLMGDDLLAVETNISTYDITNKEDSTRRRGHSLSLRSVYFLGKDQSPSTPRGQKQPVPILISPRRNKRAGQVAIFSDDDDDE